jgi:hypothetical protein
MGQFEDLFIKALAAAERGEKGYLLSSSTAAVLGSRSRGIVRYAPFNSLSPNEQQVARGMYPHKSVGAKYDFKDEHYFYPVDKTGKIFRGRGGHRVLAFSYAALMDGDIEKFGYTKNKGW